MWLRGRKKRESSLDITGWRYKHLQVLLGNAKTSGGLTLLLFIAEGKVFSCVVVFVGIS